MTILTMSYKHIKNLHEIKPYLINAKDQFLAKMDSIQLADTMQDLPSRWENKFKERLKKVNTVKLTELWGIVVKKSTATLEATNQHGVM